MQLQLDEVRRLTGPNLLSDYPGAILDVFIEDVNTMTVIECWQKHLAHCQSAIGWNEASFYRLYEGGASMSISAPMDLLYSACDLAELAWDCCVAELTETNDLDVEQRISDLKQSLANETNSELISLLKAASENQVLCLADDDEFSLGAGPSSQVWTIDNLPKINDINWQQYKQIPIALITGTNGKSTSVRLAAEIAKQAGIQAGVTSTDFIKVGNAIIDEGDYSGPGGARMLIRDKRTEMAFLEVARGGLLRRGLPVNEARAALVTNVASDHLGQYGINTVDEIAHVKLMVAKAIKSDSTLVLNADDKRLVKFVPKYFESYIEQGKPLPICWFSTNPNNPQILNNKSIGLPCVYPQNGQFIYWHNNEYSFGQIKDVPMTVLGSAKHNIENALGVIGLCKAMGLQNEAISQGLLSFGTSVSDNPGRGNLYQVAGKTVIVDFAHNAHSMQAVMQMAKGMSAEIQQNSEHNSAIHVMFSHGGDRSDKDITDVANEVMSLSPSTYILAEIECYLRGREINEISDLVEKHLLSKGVAQDSIIKVPDPTSGAKYALEHANEGDLLLLFVLSEREQIQAMLESYE